MTYSTIAIVYNPNSTGSSDTIAKDFAQQLQEAVPQQSVELRATEHVGHAEAMAYEIAMAQKNALIISSSGDGGYNEVVNGALRATREGATVTTSVLPAGNANDHYRSLHSSDLLKKITKGTTRMIDVLCIRSTAKGEPIERYAHSYAGIGITPKIGKELNKTNLNKVNEVWLVLRALFSRTSVRVVVGDKRRHYESIIFSNIDGMSKYMKVSQPSRVDDGLFEITFLRRSHPLQLVIHIVKAATVGLRQDLRVDQFSFTTIDKTLLQIDGEVVTLDPKSQVEIICKKQQLQCVV